MFIKVINIITRNSTKLFILLVLSVSCQMSVVSCLAAGSLSLSPQIQTVDLKKDPPVATITYINGSQESIQLNLSVVDFKNIDEIGTPQLISAVNNENYKYGLSAWVKLASNNLVLAPGEKKSISLEIEKEKLSQGGHYAAVLAEIKQANDSKKIPIKGMFASLLFVRADSKYNTEEAKIASVFPNKSLFNFPDSYLLRFQNTGNIDVAPHGVIDIRDVLGRHVAKGVINENSLISLPESIRRYATPITKSTNILLPGIYRSTIEIHFGDSNKKITVEDSFVYLGWPTTIVVILLIILVMGARKLGRKK